jgi:hypothetical protein
MSTRGPGLTAAALPHRSRDYAAALATAACLAELLLVPLTLLVCALLTVAARLTRWRLHWLVLPATVGAVLLLTRGPGAAVAGYLRWPQRLIADLGGSGPPGHVLALAARDLPGQLPIALLAGCAQTAALGLLAGRASGRPAPRRPGLIAAARGHRSAALLAAGRTVTYEGCALGFDPGTGRPARLSWAEARLGVLARGASPAAATGLCLPIVCAALRRRKAVIAADLSGGSEAGRAVRALAAFAGLLAGDLAGIGPRQRPAVFGQVLRQGAVIAGSADPGTVADLTSVLTNLAGLGLRGDALAWIHGCERASPAAARALISAGREAGCAVLLSTADQITADTLAGAAGIVLTAGPVPGGEFAAQPAGTFAIRTASRREAGLVAIPVRPAGPP